MYPVGSILLSIAISLRIAVSRRFVTKDLSKRSGPQSLLEQSELRYSRSSHPQVLLGKDVLKRRTPMLKYKLQSNFIEIALRHGCSPVNLLHIFSNFIEIALRHGCSPVDLLHIFRTSFPKNTSGRLFLILKYSEDGSCQKSKDRPFCENRFCKMLHLRWLAEL